ncbi:Rha family transcriptional regulator [Lysinibacillus sp. M3]|uniref:Rha family transcriptional regulator n=1 Tax=Lysinibacillus zambalensis TaxID=3160866 RepID=A0ABV1MRX9_9BACI
MVKELKVMNHEGQLVTDSRDVAEMIGKQHWEILRMLDGTKDGKTKGFAQVLTDNNFVVSDFFITHTYTDSTGRALPCYLITKKGCNMVANKMTGYSSND